MTILAIIFIILLLWIIFRIYSLPHSPPETITKLSDYQQVKEQIELLNATISNIDSLNNLLIDISVCDADALKSVCISVPDSLSRDSKHSIIIDGSDDNSQMLKTIARSEKQRLTDSLLDQIEELHSMIVCNGNVTKTIEENREGE